MERSAGVSIALTTILCEFSPVKLDLLRISRRSALATLDTDETFVIATTWKTYGFQRYDFTCVYI